MNKMLWPHSWLRADALPGPPWPSNTPPPSRPQRSPSLPKGSPALTPLQPLWSCSSLDTASSLLFWSLWSMFSLPEPLSLTPLSCLTHLLWILCTHYHPDHVISPVAPSHVHSPFLVICSFFLYSNYCLLSYCMIYLFISIIVYCLSPSARK